MRALSILFVAAGWLGCGGDGDGGGGGADLAGPVAIMPEVISALPSFLPSTETARVAAAIGDPITDALILNRFKLECHGQDPAIQNDCPDGVPLDLSTKYSSDTVLGLIAGAGQNADQILQRAQLGTCKVEGIATEARGVTLASFVSDDAGGEGARYLVDELSRLACVADVSPTRHVAWAIPDRARRETTTFVNGEPSGTSSQLAISQSVITLDEDGQPRAIALNEVNLTIHQPSGASNSRAVVVANLQSRRFLVKMSGGPALLGVLVAGQAGMSATGEASPGLFFAVTDEGPGTAVCVDNETKTQADGCVVEAAAWSEGTTPASYLELTADDAAAFAGYLAVFADGPTASQLPVSAFPSGTADQIHFPDHFD